LPKLPILTAKDAESMLLKAGYAFIRGAGSHRIYMKGKNRVVIPFHAGKSLHPKIVKEVLLAIGE
jgi:predicted RNA binding protein YcfA (HicA-like mRNA interferase family)